MLGQALNKLAYPKIIPRPIVIRKLTENFPRQDFFEPQEVECLLPHLPDYLQDYVRFAWYSGWRKGEISSLTFSEVHLSAKEIRLSPRNRKTVNPVSWYSLETFCPLSRSEIGNRSMDARMCFTGKGNLPEISGKLGEMLANRQGYLYATLT